MESETLRLLKHLTAEDH